MGTMLVVADINDKCVATSRGLQLAEKLGHSVEVVAFTYASLGRVKRSAKEKAALKKQLLAAREVAITARIDKFKAPGQKVNLKVVWEKDIPGWVSRRTAKAFDLVVKTGSKSGSRIHTSLDWELLRECPVPVLIVAEKKWHRVRPVLAALDLGSSSSAKKRLNHQIIVTAQDTARALDADVKFICAVEMPTLLADLDLIEPRTYVKEAKEQMLPHIRELAAKYELPLGAFKVKRGPVEKVIASEAARHRAQLVVMGTVARKGVRARLLGNTAERVLKHMKTDVLALKLKE